MGKKEKGIVITRYNPWETIADAPCLVGYDPNGEYCTICDHSVAWESQENGKAYKCAIRSKNDIYICTLFYCSQHKESEVESDSKKQRIEILDRKNKDALFTIEGKVERLYRIGRNRDILQEHFLNETLEEIHKENTSTTKKAMWISIGFGLMFFIASIVVTLLLKN